MSSQAEIQLKVTAKDEASRELAGIGNVLEGVGKAAAVAAAAVAAAGAAVSAFAVSSLKDFSEVGDEIDKMSIRTGMAAESISGFRVAAEMSGTSIGAVENGVKMMSKTMAAFADDADLAKDTLSVLGINFDTIKNLKPEEQFAKLGFAVSQLPDASTRTATAMALFGKSGTDLIPMFGEMGGGLDAMKDKARELGVMFDAEAAAKAAKLDDTMGELKTSVAGVKMALAEQLAPAVIDIIKKVTDAIVVFREWAVNVQDNGGIINFITEKIRSTFAALFAVIEAKTGLITILKTAWERIATVWKELVAPELAKLWEQLKPLQPFLQILAEIVGVILYGAFVGLVKLIETVVLGGLALLTVQLKNLNATVDSIAKAWDWFTTQLSKAITFIDTLISKFKELNIVSKATSAVSGWLGFGGGKADGGPVSPNRAYMVGEQGPEMFVPPAYGNIVPMVAGAGAGGISVFISGNNISNQMDLDSIARRVGDSIIGALKNQRRID